MIDVATCTIILAIGMAIQRHESTMYLLKSNYEHYWNEWRGTLHNRFGVLEKEHGCHL